MNERLSRLRVLRSSAVKGTGRVSLAEVCGNETTFVSLLGVLQVRALAVALRAQEPGPAPSLICVTYVRPSFLLRLGPGSRVDASSSPP